MTTSSAHASFSIDVNPSNPGQFLACCGLAVLAEHLWPGAETWFDGAFHVHGRSVPENGAGEVIDIVSGMSITVDESRGTSATHPVCLDELGLVLDWWLDPGDWTDGGQSAFKMWAGQQASAGIVEQLRDGLCEGFTEACAEEALDWSVPLTGRFGFDPRSAWRAIDVGFSPNEQSIEVATFPVVELFAAIGLQSCRLRRRTRRFRYATWASAVPALLVPPSALDLLPTGGHSWSFEIVRRGSYKGFGQSTLSEPNADE